MFLQKYTGELPEVDYSVPKKKLQCVIEDFISMQTKTATVTFDADEYSNSYHAYRSLHKACIVGRHPVKAVFRQDTIFLVRTDM